MRGPNSNDRTVLVVELLALFVPLWKLQSLIAPEPLDLLVIDPPALDIEQFGDLTIAISAVLLCKPDDCPR